MGDIHEMKELLTCETWYETNGVKYDAFRMAFRELGLENFSKKRVLSSDELSLIEAYPFRKKKNNRTAKQPAKKAQTVSTPTAKDQPGTTPAPSRYRAGDWIRSDRFLVVVMCLSLLAQMIHTAGFFFHNSPIQEPFDLNIILCILFAIGVDCTALVLTAWRGGWGYIAGFALIHFAMNLNFHWEQHDKAITFGQILLSFVIAISNFSYIELFSKRFEQ